MPPIKIEIPCPAAPVTGHAAWDEAFLRVESYLRAHHLESRVVLNQLVTDIIREARERVLGNPAEEPVIAAMRVAHARIGSWFARAGNSGDWSDERVRARARLTLVLGDLPVNWRDTFLSTGPLPAELGPALRSAVLQPGPELRFSNMPPAPLEFGFADPDEPSSLRKGMWSTARDAAGWLLVAGVYGVAWAASH